MNPKTAIIYYSATGTTYELAKAVEEGAREAGAETRLLKVHELAPEEAIKTNQGWVNHRLETQHVAEAQLSDLEWADAIVFGTPTRFGLPSAQLKQFIDQTGGLWFQGKLADKVASSFTSTGSNGGRETTITALNNTFYHWGAIIVAPSYLDPIQFEAGNPYGAHFASNNGQNKPDETALASAHFQGKRTTQIAARLLKGRLAELNGDVSID